MGEAAAVPRLLGHLASSTSARSGRSSATASRSGRCCRSTSSPAATPPRRPRCTPPRSRSSARCSARSPGPFGGELADRIGGGKVTLVHLRRDGRSPRGPGRGGHRRRRTAGAAAALMIGYVLGFIVLFVLSGIGNGSMYKMIPVDLRGEGRSGQDDLDGGGRAAWSRSMSGALIGFAGAIGALGGVCINLALRAVLHRLGQVRDQRLLGLPRLLRGVRGVTWLVFLRHPSAEAVQRPPEDARRRRRLIEPRTRDGSSSTGSESLVVVGHGMVGHRFVEALRARDDAAASGRSIVLCEERRAGLRPGGALVLRRLLGSRRNSPSPATTTRATTWSTCVLGEPRTDDRPRRPHGHHRPRRRARVRRAGAGHRLVPVRAAGARPRPDRLLRLPHPRRPRRASGRAPRPPARRDGRRRRRRPARAGGRQRAAAAGHDHRTSSSSRRG